VNKTTKKIKFDEHCSVVGRGYTNLQIQTLDMVHEKNKLEYFANIS
jgi:hypothetical protein